MEHRVWSVVSFDSPVSLFFLLRNCYNEGDSRFFYAVTLKISHEKDVADNTMLHIRMVGEKASCSERIPVL